MVDLQAQPTFGPGGLVNVIVEASRGTTVKSSYDQDLGLFVFGRPLPHGLHYPYDWGFIPSTKGEDGDPLDAMVLHDAACPVGCLVRCQPVAMLKIRQREKGKSARNDRLLFRPGTDQAMKEQNMLTARIKRELEQFFQSAIMGTGKTLILDGWRGPKEVVAAVRKGARAGESD
jgi:inorganic pyrophosphatase